MIKTIAKFFNSTLGKVLIVAGIFYIVWDKFWNKNNSDVDHSWFRQNDTPEDNAAGTEGAKFLDFINFLNLPAVRASYVEVTADKTYTVKDYPVNNGFAKPLFATELAKLYSNAADSTGMTKADLTNTTKIAAAYAAPVANTSTSTTEIDAAKKAIVFNADVAKRLQEALGLKELDDDSASAIYTFAKTKKADGTYPNLTDITTEWKGNATKYQGTYVTLPITSAPSA